MIETICAGPPQGMRMRPASSPIRPDPAPARNGRPARAISAMRPPAVQPAKNGRAFSGSLSPKAGAASPTAPATATSDVSATAVSMWCQPKRASRDATIAHSAQKPNSIRIQRAWTVKPTAMASKASAIPALRSSQRPLA